MERGMRGRGAEGRSPTDLVLCLPSRGHRSSMPKPIFGPSRPILKRLLPPRPTTNHGPAAHSGTKPKHVSPEDAEEPTSPKVTCAGQIKVRPKPNSGPKNRLSVAEEIGRLQKHLLHFARSLRFSMKCFGSFDDFEEDDGEEDDGENDGFEEEEEPPPPPTNALRLMRSKSEPSKGWLGEDEGEMRGGGEEVGGSSSSRSVRMIKEEDDDDDEEEEEKKLILMRYGPDFYKLSMDIAKETWVVGSADPLGRSRSWKR